MSTSIFNHRQALFLLAFLVLFQCSRSQQQLITLEYDLMDQTCSLTPLRSYSAPIGVCITNGGSTGYQVTLPTSTTYVVNTGQTFKNCVNETFTQPVNTGHTDGRCFNPTRPIGTGPPSTRTYANGVLPPVYPTSNPIVQYSTYGDAGCILLASYVSIYNQTKTECFKRDPDTVGTYRCTPTGVSVTYYKNTYPDKPPTTCAGSQVYTEVFPFGVCRRDSLTNADKWLIFRSCVSSGMTSVMSGILGVGLIMLFI